MNVRIVESIEDFKRALGLSQSGVLLESDLDLVEVDTDAHGRNRRDAEALCTLAANSRTDVLELGTSQGRGAFKLASNLAPGLRCHTVNILPEQYDLSGGKMITHLISKEDIGCFYRERGIQNVVQYYANTARWELPPQIQGVGMVFVDAAHDEENVYLDFKLVWDRIAPGGFLVWHDFSPFCRHFDWILASMRGAERFARDLGLESIEIVNLRNSWCGVLRKPSHEKSEIIHETRIQVVGNGSEPKSGATQPSPETSYPGSRSEKAQPSQSPLLGSACSPPEILRKLRYAIVYPAYSAARVAEATHLAARLERLNRKFPRPSCAAKGGPVATCRRAISSVFTAGRGSVGTFTTPSAP